MKDELLETRFVQIDSTLTPLDLRPQLWAAIEQVAEKKGVSWQEWVAQELRQMPTEITNRGIWLGSQVKKAFNEMLLHSAAVDTGLETEYGEYEAPENVPPHVLLKDVWVGPHETFERVLRESGVQIVYSIDCKGFFLYAGYRDGTPLLIIENERSDGLSLVYQIEQ
jgi:hypothetical protein